MSRNLSNSIVLGVDSGDDDDGEDDEDDDDDDHDDDNEESVGAGSGSSWNIDLPDVADLCGASSPPPGHGHLPSFGTSGGDPAIPRGSSDYPEPDICANVIEHLNEEIDKRNEDLAKNEAVIRAMEQEIREKDSIIR